MASDFPTVLEAFSSYSAVKADYNRLVQLCETSAPPRQVPREASEKLFAEAAAVLLVYYDVRNWPDGREQAPAHHFPTELAADICGQIRLIMAGIGRGPVGDLLAGRGVPSNGPDEMRAQGWAVAYVSLASEGVIADPHPVPTAANAFGVSRRTIERWRDAQARMGIVWRDIVGSDVPDHQIASHVMTKMREASDRYAVKGRFATSRRKPDPGLKLITPRSRR